jgi:hypothetical protein
MAERDARSAAENFIVLSGDDAITMPADRARRPRHHFGGLERDSRRDDASWRKPACGDFAAARLQRRYLPLMRSTSSSPIRFR